MMCFSSNSFPWSNTLYQLTLPNFKLLRALIARVLFLSPYLFIRVCNL